MFENRILLRFRLLRIARTPFSPFVVLLVREEFLLIIAYSNNYQPGFLGLIINFFQDSGYNHVPRMFWRRMVVPILVAGQI